MAVTTSLLICISSLCCLISYVESCNPSSCFSRKEEFRECSRTGFPVVETPYLTFANISSDALLDSQTLFPLILSLLCNERGLQWKEQQPPPYCAEMNLIKITKCNESASCSNCAQFSLVVHDQWVGNASISSSLIIDMLSLESSRVALALAGFVLIQNSTHNGSTPQMSAVPIASWICLGLGVIISSVALFKPLWWDRGLKRIRTCCKRI